MAVNASDARKLRRAKFMPSKIGETTPMLNQRNLQTGSALIESRGQASLTLGRRYHRRYIRLRRPFDGVACGKLLLVDKRQ